MTIAIVGAGMAGLACAAALASAGHAVALFDKGSRPGGRMSTRIFATPSGEASFDHGAQYFTARDAGFETTVARWRAAGVVALWPAGGAGAFVGVPGMSAPIAAMAEARDVKWASRVDGLHRRDDRWCLNGVGSDEAYEAVIIAVPAEQVAALVGAFDAEMADRATATPSTPCWTVMAAFSERIPVATDVLKDAGIIGWAARNSAKPGRSGPEAWVIQAGPSWSADHLEDDAELVSAALLDAFAGVAGIGLPEPIAKAAHRWRYAKSGKAGERFLWNEALKLGVCGDWLIGPRIESAWVSGTALAGAIGRSAIGRGGASRP